MNFVRRPLEMLIGMVFIISSLIHVAGPYFYLESAIRYEIAGSSLLVWTLPLLTALQISVGVALLFGMFVRPALVLSGLMFLSFAVAQIAVLSRGIQVSCGCFGSASEVVSIYSVLRLVFLLMLVVGLFYFSNRAMATDKVDSNLEVQV